jgi:hypothetical protein
LKLIIAGEDMLKARIRELERGSKLASQLSILCGCIC